MEQRKLRILCLHGYRQNGLKFKGRSAAIKRTIKNIADLTYIDAPVEIPCLTEQEGSGRQYGWWEYTASGTYEGVENGLAYVERVIESDGPFDGVLAFSQGAICASFLTQHFRFGIFIAGRLPRTGTIPESINTIASLHIIGEKDEVILPAQSKALRDRFVQAETIVHDGGHYIPANAPIRQGIKRFLIQQQEQLVCQ